eukprot:2733341-Amphidinium_carterae.2
MQCQHVAKHCLRALDNIEDAPFVHMTETRLSTVSLVLWQRQGGFFYVMATLKCSKLLLRTACGHFRNRF